MDAPIALRDILARLGAELADLGLCADDVQDLISVLAEQSSHTIGANARMQLQGVDSLAQRLARLAALVSLLEQAVPEEFHIGSSSVTPEMLAGALGRLRGAGRISSEATGPTAGEFELF